MKVLLLNDYGCLSGGAERLTVVLRDALRKRGHDARLFTSSAMPVAADNPADYTCYGTESPLQKLLQVANPMAAYRLRRVLARFKPDIVHVRSFLGQLSPVILPQIASYPAVLHLGGYQVACPINLRILPDGSDCAFVPGRACYDAGCVTLAGLARTQVQFGAWRKWRGVFDHIVANSHALARRLAEGGVDASVVIWNGTPVRPPRPPLKNPPAVGFAGRLVERKGVRVLLEAMVRVRERVPGARLVIAGGGPDEADFRKLAIEFALGDSVEFTGHLSAAEVERRMSAAWVMAVPSLVQEAFSNTALESMMRGTMVVASDVGGFPEMIEPGVSGMLVPRGDADALADSLVTCLADRERCDKMGAQARERALREFSAETMGGRFIELYSSITVGTRHRTTRRGVLSRLIPPTGAP